jgi:3',5'-cyclic AMP phosphodiesterase CpdA
MNMSNEFRLTQVADVHLGAGVEHHYDNWLKVAAWIGRERPDLVVANGDLIMGDPDEEADYSFARQQLSALPVPCRFLPGNHDIGDNVISGRMAKRVNDERRSRFVRYFGEERWAFERAGWGFVGLNSQLFGSAGQPAEAEQWKWLEDTLSAFGKGPAAIFLHKPLFLDHPSERDYDDNLLLRQSVLDSGSRARLLDLCRRHHVRLVSTGHKHQTRAFLLDGIYYIWAPSTACVNGAPTALHWGVREVGFVDYRFRPGAFEHRIVGADFLFRHENYVTRHGAAPH